MRRIGILFIASVLVAACGSSSGSKATAPKPSTTSSTTADSATSDRRIVAAGLLRSADLPGFSSAPSSPEVEGIDQLAEGLSECANFVAKQQPGANKRKSRRFTRGQEHATSAADAYPTVDAIRAQLDLYQDPTTVDCFHALYLKAITENLGANGTVDDVSVSPIAVENLGDGQFGFRITANLSSQGQPATLTSDIIGVMVGRFGLQLNLDGTTAELAELETTLLPKLVDRMQTAGA